MDHFGIGAGMQSAAQIYFQAARRTGRTTSLVESVKEGDRIVFANAKEAERVRKLCLERGINVDCIVIAPKEPEKLFERGTSEGRTIFEHSWIEQMYMNSLGTIQQLIDHWEQQTSGYGAAHRETKRRFEELAKWQP